MKSRKPIQLIIPEQCQQKWDEMHVRNEGRFCDHCQKTVIDFTMFTDKDLYAFFDKHENEKVCGRFLSTQLNREIQLPYQPHSRLYKIAVALGLVLSFSQLPEMQARWQAPLVVENSIFDAQKEDENIEGDSMVVRGRVVDEKNMEVIGVIVEVSENGKIIAGVVTEEDGIFEVNLNNVNNSVTIRTKYTGYKEVSLTLSKNQLSSFQQIKLTELSDIEKDVMILTGKIPLIKDEKPRRFGIIFLVKKMHNSCTCHQWCQRRKSLIGLVLLG